MLFKEIIKFNNKFLINKLKQPNIVILNKIKAQLDSKFLKF